jgi:hypothetical protein
MENPYLSSFGRLEHRKAEVLRLLNRWPEEDLARKPSPGAWSALEVLDHLLKTEASVRHSCQENLKSRHNIVTLAAKARAVTFLTLMRTPVRVTVPAAVSFVLPEAPASLENVLSRWDAERRELRMLLGTLTEEAGNVGVLRHPAVGWLDLRGALAFLSVHLRHHEFQIRRIAAALIPEINARRKKV